MRPRPNVFTGFDQVLDHGRVVGLEMPKNIYFDAAVFTQVALKSQWQDSVLRRETIGSDGQLIMPPRFGERIGYCPTFLMADEAQQSATPKDAEFKAVCRSKRASMWELTQCHSSIRGAFGPQRAADANTYFQNSMTHVYLRQSDIDSMKVIQEECGKKLVQRTSLAITEGGRASELSYVQGGIVHDAVGVSATKTVGTEEKPFVEVEELKGVSNNVAVVLPSNGDRTLPATIAYLRPLWVLKKRKDVAIETSWLDWPEELRATYDLDNIPQQASWRGWEIDGPLDESSVVPAASRLGRFIEPVPDKPPDATSAGGERAIVGELAAAVDDGVLLPPAARKLDPVEDAPPEPFAVARSDAGRDLPRQATRSPTSRWTTTDVGPTRCLLCRWSPESSNLKDRVTVRRRTVFVVSTKRDEVSNHVRFLRLGIEREPRLHEVHVRRESQRVLLDRIRGEIASLRSGPRQIRLKYIRIDRLTIWRSC